MMFPQILEFITPANLLFYFLSQFDNQCPTTSALANLTSPWGVLEFLWEAATKTTSAHGHGLPRSPRIHPDLLWFAPCPRGSPTSIGARGRSCYAVPKRRLAWRPVRWPLRRGCELFVPRFTSPCALERKESFHQNFPSSEAAKNIIKVFLLIFPPTFYPQNRMYYNCESIQIITIIHIKFNSELSYSK